jgi:hypothetical protein
MPPKRIKRFKGHLEAGEVEGLGDVGWFTAITHKGPTKILNGSGIERDIDDDEDLEDIDDVIKIRTYILDNEE